MTREEHASADEAWKTLASAEPNRDPGASIRGAFAVAVTVAAPPALTLATLPPVRVAEEGEPLPDAEYQVTGLLGEGGMGRVLLARQRSLHRDVAIKVLGSRASSEAAAGLVAEAVVAGSLEHPNVVPVHALGLDASGRPVLVMKRIEGVSLRDLLRDDAHPVWSTIAEDAADRLDAKLETLMAVCNAVHFAHSRGIVHRDLKPDNVMIGSFGEVYVVDWGIAVRLGDPRAFGDRSKGPVGTPAYMAREMVLSDHAHIDARTDVYLLGATLHAALTGHPRHRGDNLYEVMFSAIESSPFAYSADVPAELAALCNRAMHADPTARFATALELRRAIAAYRRHRGSISLSDEAAVRLREALALGPGGSHGQRVHALLTESRFGFSQALRAWPENAPAGAGLADCLVAMIEVELVGRDAAGARALYEELPEPRPALAARIEALARELTATAAAARDRDMSIGGGAQLAVVGAMPAVAAFVVVYLVRRGGGPLAPAELVAPPLLALVVLSIVGLVARPRLTTSASRHALGILLLLPASAVIHRVLTLELGAPASVIMTGDLVICATLLGGMSVAVSRHLLPAALATLAGAIAIAVRPDLALPIFASSVMGGFALILWGWRRMVRAGAPRT
jgi:serine/threonine-protein kinase